MRYYEILLFLAFLASRLASADQPNLDPGSYACYSENFIHKALGIMKIVVFTSQDPFKIDPSCRGNETTFEELKNVKDYHPSKFNGYCYSTSGKLCSKYPPELPPTNKSQNQEPVELDPGATSTNHSQNQEDAGLGWFPICTSKSQDQEDAGLDPWPIVLIVILVICVCLEYKSFMYKVAVAVIIVVCFYYRRLVNFMCPTDEGREHDSDFDYVFRNADNAEQATSDIPRPSAPDHPEHAARGNRGQPRQDIQLNILNP